ncbi:MAG TPA: cytochrome c [Longimicrobiaceae bacterium]|nr:cytochrome c [Longimicrobiaceae bacterium]
MRQALRAHRKIAGSLLRTVPALLVSLSACLPEGGYDKVTRREQEELPPTEFPEPPAPVAGIGQAGGGARIVATNLPAGVTQAMVDEGQQLYGTVCVACHMAGGTGGPVAPALNDNQWIWVPGGEYPGIVQIINSGVPAPKQHSGPMPPRGGGSFTDAQVRAIAAYVYALSHQGQGGA